eukprot:TRINITY_DN7993_c0_g1_i1.p1 TRINITY_DN7993_c0_g1~~TRINITY_DN7993_c0_g1_i1.p1  ORF type:complete len:552 (-),score=48.16 TRINITY_DN7993_c0_g1_i1:90-1745(-)
MSLIFVDEEQLMLKLPTELWHAIVQFCIDPKLEYSRASFKLIQRVLPAVSKKFQHIMKTWTISLEDFPYDHAQLRSGSMTTYCCIRGYTTLLSYAIERGATIVSRTSYEAARCGHLDCFKVLVEDHGLPCDESLLNAAAERHQIHVVKYLIDKKVKPSTLTINTAVKSGSIELLKFFQGLVTIQYDYLVFCAAYSGNLEMVKFIEQYKPLEQNDIFGTAQSGSIEVLQYFLDKGFVLENSSLCQIAIERGHREFVKFAINHGVPMSEELIQSSAEKNDAELIKELRAKECPWNGAAIKMAAATGSFEALKFLIDNGCPYDGDFSESADITATVLAAHRGYVDCLQYLMEHGAPYPDNIIEEVLTSTDENLLTVLKYLHGRGCSWSAWAPAVVASDNYCALDVLKYLHENKCPWDERTCAYAAKMDHLNFLKYAVENGCPCGSKTMNKAARSGSLKILQFLFEKGVPWTNKTCTLLMRHEKDEMLKYARENGAPWPAEPITSTNLPYLNIFPRLKYLVENGCPWDPQEILEWARLCGYEEIVEWIQNNATSK